MSQAFFTALSGMLTFSGNLDTISNNISNMNTPGFRGSDVFYRNLINANGVGIGPQILDQTLRFQSGDIRQTGIGTELAISGQGYFILEKDGEYFYTRAGKFTFDDDGVLIDQNSKSKVMGFDENGTLQEINISDLLTLPPQATTQVNFDGNLSTGSSDHDINGIKVFNEIGEEITLNFNFTNDTANTAGNWLVEVTAEDGRVIGNGEIRFGPDGTLLDGFNLVDITVSADLNGTLGTAMDLSLSFGEPGSFTGTTSFSGGTVSTASANLEDGNSAQPFISVNFNEQGEVVIKYANDEEKTGATIALAFFQNEGALNLIDGYRFTANSSVSVEYGRPGDEVFGSIAPGSIELSNVELAREFADMIIVQRGYQASSRVMNVANQMIEQLYENTRG